MTKILKTVGFLGIAAIVFVLSFAVLLAFDLVPEGETSPAVSQKEESKPVAAEKVEAPIRIVARDIGLDASVLNPTSKDIGILDKALLSGAVRYPGTALLGQEGTALLFGHSSYLPLVQNKNFKIFNEVEKLEQGAIISVYSGAREYRYKVVRQEVAKATADRIDLEQNGRFLKLVTCNSFGAKEDRFVVTAEFVGAFEADSSS